MTDRRLIKIEISQLYDGKVSVDLGVGAYHSSRVGKRFIPLQNSHRRTAAPYVSELTPALAAELVRAVSLVLAGFYETSELPF